jgi:hypothetical protein
VPIPVLLASALVAGPAFACAAGDVHLAKFQGQIGTYHDGSGKVVRLSGEIASTCTTGVTVELAVSERDAANNILLIRQVALPPMPAGGGPFDLIGAIPYDNTVTNYTASISLVR